LSLLYDIENKYSQRSVLGVNSKLYNDAVNALKPENRATFEQKQMALKQAMAIETKRNEYDKQRDLIVDLIVRANMIGMDFFQTKDLVGSQVPMYRYKNTRDAIPVNRVANFGKGASVIWTDSTGSTSVTLQQHETAKVIYPIWDLVQGFVDKSEEVNEDLAYYVLNYLDDMAWTAINSAFGSFTSTTWILDPKIKDAPTTNDIDLSSVCDGSVNKYLFAGIIDHFARLQKPIRAVYLPAALKTDMLGWVSVSGSDINAADTIPAEVQAEIWKTAGLRQGGIVPPMIWSNVLDGTTTGSIYAYAVTNTPCGFFYQKPEGHWVKTQENGRFFETQKFFTGVFDIPAYLKPEIARFKIG
jgi:hypothetical protein